MLLRFQKVCQEITRQRFSGSQPNWTQADYGGDKDDRRHWHHSLVNLWARQRVQYKTGYSGNPGKVLVESEHAGAVFHGNGPNQRVDSR